MSSNPTLNDLVAEPRTLHVGGKELQIAPLKVRQLPAFVRIAKPLIDELALVTVLGPLEIADLIGTHGEQLVEAAAVATGEPVLWIGALDLADFVDLVSAVVEANADFFVRRLVPALDLATSRMRAMAALTAGSGSALTSSGGATATAT